MKRWLVYILSILICGMNTTAPLYAMEQEEVEDIIVEEESIVEQEETVEEEESPSEEAFAPEQEVIVEENKQDPIFYYVFVKNAQLDTTETQTVVVSVDQPVEDMKLIVSSNFNTYTLECTNINNTVYEFDQNFTELGTYKIQTIQYTINGETKENNVDSVNATFEVVENVDGYVASIFSNSKEEAINKIENALSNVNFDQNIIITLDPAYGTDLNLEMAVQLKSYLEQYENVTVYLTRSDDSYLTMDQRIEMAQSYQSDVLIGIHMGEEKFTSASHVYSLIEDETLDQKIQVELTSFNLNADQKEDARDLIRKAKNVGMSSLILEHTNLDSFTDISEIANMDGEAIAQSLVLERSEVVEETKSNAADALKGYSILLDGSIGVNFYMSLSQETIEDEQAYLLVSIPNSDTYTEKKIYVKDVQTKNVNQQMYYVFPCEVATKELTSEIKVKLITSKGQGTEYTFSVDSYANYIIEHENEYSSKMVEIAKALKTYGRATQIYFDYNVENLPTGVDLIQPSDFSKYQKKIIQEDEKIQFRGARLILKSEIGMKLYFEGGDAFYIDGNKVETTQENGYQVVTISNINYMNLDQMFTITSGNLEMEYGFLSYAYEASQSENTDLKNIVYSLYNFYTALYEEEIVDLPKYNDKATLTRFKKGGVIYAANCSDIQWQEDVRDGQTAGMTVDPKRMEAFRVELGDAIPYAGGIQYRSYLEKNGWESDYKKDGEISGTTGQYVQIEGVQIQLYGEVSQYYDVYYRVNSQDFGWLGWAKNGESAGTVNGSYRMQAIEIQLFEKGDTSAPVTEGSYIQIHQYIPTYYSQEDPQWEYHEFGKYTFKNNGCLPTSASMAIDGILKNGVMPIDVGSYLYDNTKLFNRVSWGSYTVATKYAAEHWGLKTVEIDSEEALYKSLRTGNIVVLSVGPDYFTSVGYRHAVVLFKCKDGKTYVYDPQKSSKNGWYSIEYMWKQAISGIKDPSGILFGYGIYQ